MRDKNILVSFHIFLRQPTEKYTKYLNIYIPKIAEHRIPYNGVQGFPTNVTLQRFLELHIEITGDLPDPTSGMY